MTNLQALLAQKAALERQISEVSSASRAKAISDIKALMAEHGLNLVDLSASAGGAREGKKTAGSKVKPKYRDPVSGSTWTGRGLKPKWLSAAIAEGKTVSDFLI